MHSGGVEASNCVALQRKHNFALGIAAYYIHHLHPKRMHATPPILAYLNVQSRFPHLQRQRLAKCVCPTCATHGNPVRQWIRADLLLRCACRLRRRNRERDRDCGSALVSARCVDCHALNAFAVCAGLPGKTGAALVAGLAGEEGCGEVIVFEGFEGPGRAGAISSWGNLGKKRLTGA